MYSGAFRGLVKSMLRKNPELRPTAAELLNHPHLQPYIHKIYLTLNRPRRSTFPFQWPEPNYARRTRFIEPEYVSSLSDQDKHLSLTNGRALNPSISGTEQGSLCSTQIAHESYTYSEEKMYELSYGCVHDKFHTKKSKPRKSSAFKRTPKLRTDKDSATPRSQTLTPSKTSRLDSKRGSIPVSHTPTRRASLPLHTRAKATPPPPHRGSNSDFLQSMNSPIVSVNSPRIDKIAEFPLASCEDHNFFPIHGPSSASACSNSSYDGSDECSTITKDKCTIQVLDKATVHSTNNTSDASYGAHGIVKGVV